MTHWRPSPGVTPHFTEQLMASMKKLTLQILSWSVGAMTPCITVAIFVLLGAFTFVTSEAAADDESIVKVEGEARLNGRLTLFIPDLPRLIAPRPDPQKMILFLDGEPMIGLVPLIDLDENALHFQIDPSKIKSSWSNLVSRNLFQTNDEISVTVGFDNGHLLKGKMVKLRIIQHPLAAGIFVLLFIGSILSFLFLVHTSDILRDRHYFPPRGSRRPYSLASTQLAIWFFAILASFIFIYLINLDWPDIPTGVLTVLGISTATALTATAVDANKKATTSSQLQDIGSPQATDVATQGAARVAQLRRTTTTAIALVNQLAIPSVDFLTDILTDADGISLHRFQIVVWTVVLVGMFLFKVVTTLSMPDLNAAQLTLLGISSGAYLGFKIPEKQGVSE